MCSTDELYFLRRIREIREIYYKGKLDEAFKLSNEIYEDIFHRLGADSPITLKMRNLIGNIYCAMEKYNEALHVHDEVYRKRLDSFGPNHQKTLGSLTNKGYVLLKKCEFIGAMAIFREVHQKRKMLLGSNNIKTLRSLKGIASVHSEEGTFNKAEEILRLILHIHREDNRESILVRKELASLYFKQDNYEKALGCWKRIHSHEKRFNPLDPATLLTLSNIANVVLLRGDYCEAKRIYEKILRVQKSIDVNQNTVDTEKNIAVSLALQGKYSTAQKIFRKLAKDSEQTLGPKHSITLSIRTSQGIVLYLQKHYSRALTIFNEIRAVREECFGFYHPEALNTKCDIARIYVRQKRYEEALTLYNEIRELRYAMFRPQHPDCLSVDTEIARVYAKQRKYDKAFEIFSELYIRKADIDGVHHPYTSKMKAEINSIRDKVSEPRLITATKEGDLNKVILYLENGDNVNVRDIDGNVPLHIASQKGCTEILKVLLKNSAIFEIFNFDLKMPRHVASNDECNKLFYLLRRLDSSLFNNDLEAVKVVIEEERSIVNAKDLHGYTPLHLASGAGSEDIVRILLDNGADQKVVSTKGEIALHRAVARGHYVTVETLLQNLEQYDTDEFQKCINAKFIDGRTPLHLAASRSDLRIVKVLLAHNANPMIENKFRKLPFDLTRDDEIKKLLFIFSVIS